MAADFVITKSSQQCEKKKPVLGPANTAVAVKGYYKCRFFNVHQSLSPLKVIRVSIIMK